MISYKYSFKEFLDFVKDKDVGEILSLAHQECYEAERKITGGVKGAPKARKEGCPEYVNLLKGFIFFFTNGIKPIGVSNLEFQSFKPIVKDLVKKGTMKGDFWLGFFED